MASVASQIRTELVLYLAEKITLSDLADCLLSRWSADDPVADYLVRKAEASLIEHSAGLLADHELRERLACLLDLDPNSGED